MIHILVIASIFIQFINARNDIISVMSFNFPNATKNDWEKIGTALKFIEDKKGKRIKAAQKIITEYKPTFVCFQETHSGDIENFLESDFIQSTYEVYAPKISDSSGETNAIFYSKDYKILDKGIIYLNEKKKKGLKSWDDKHERACTWIYVQHKDDAAHKFYVFNVHLGLTNDSRINGLKLIYDKAMEAKKPSD